MTKKTRNAQRPTLNAQSTSKRTPHADQPRPDIKWLGVREEEGRYALRASTRNAQRPTPNAQSGTAARFDLEDRLLEFSARIICLVDALPNTRAANHIAGQLLSSGTSPYGHHGEVEAAESRRDFVHKLRVCLKELKETRRWLRLLQKSGLIPERKMVAILTETEELIKIFFSSVRTAEKNAEKGSS
jgi:four helix bundle protein